jgi:predicted enzyme related to lactoylglutathione lyase
VSETRAALPRAAQLSRIGQIAVNVRDVKRAIAFYRDTLGMEFLFEVPSMGFFNCGGIRLMLAEAESTESDHPASIVYYGVDDIGQTFDMLSQRGVEFVSPPRRIATVADHELWMAFFRDCEQNVLGLMSEVPRG